ISFSLPETGWVTLDVYDTMGREVGRLIDGIKSAGSHQTRFNALGLSNGIYFYRLNIDGKTLTHTMMLLK
ncbi:MAG: T9SS type A sorting domain-containing protein, partial [Balneolales bacterium]